jgi:hypothetical protein
MKATGKVPLIVSKTSGLQQENTTTQGKQAAYGGTPGPPPPERTQRVRAGPNEAGKHKRHSQAAPRTRVHTRTPTWTRS